MSASAFCSARISGVAMRSVHLYSDHVALDEDLEGVDGDVGRKVERLAALQVEERAVARALHRAPLEVDVALEQQPVVGAAAVLEGEQVAVGVDDADLEVLDLDDARGAGRQVRDGADVDEGSHVVADPSASPTSAVGFASGSVAADARRGRPAPGRE